MKGIIGYKVIKSEQGCFTSIFSCMQADTGDSVMNEVWCLTAPSGGFFM